MLEEENAVDDLERRLRENHFNCLKNGYCDPRATISYIEIIHNLERIAGHCDNIDEIVIGDRENTLDIKHKFDT